MRTAKMSVGREKKSVKERKKKHDSFTLVLYLKGNEMIINSIMIIIRDVIIAVCVVISSIVVAINIMLSLIITVLLSSSTSSFHNEVRDYLIITLLLTIPDFIIVTINFVIIMVAINYVVLLIIGELYSPIYKKYLFYSHYFHGYHKLY